MCVTETSFSPTVGFLELSADFIDFVRDEVVDRATEFDL